MSSPKLNVCVGLLWLFAACLSSANGAGQPVWTAPTKPPTAAPVWMVPTKPPTKPPTPAPVWMVPTKPPTVATTPGPTAVSTNAPTVAATPGSTAGPTFAPTEVATAGPTTATTAPAAATAGPTSATVPTTCVSEQVVSFEDFEINGKVGWTNGKLSKCDYFTRFLGRYGSADADPFKTYTGIPTDGSSVVVEFDFYEIDSWEKIQGDAAYINIDGVQIPIGIFDALTDEGATSASVGDIQITTVSQGAPAQHCFRKQVDKKWYDQKHHVKVTLPSSFVSDGKLVVKFETRVS